MAVAQAAAQGATTTGECGKGERATVTCHTTSHTTRLPTHPHRIRTRRHRTSHPTQPPYQPPPYQPPPYQPPYQPQQYDSPPPSVKALKKQIRGLKAAQAIPGQEPSAMAARAQQIDGLECELDERERKFRKYCSW